jgi:hypothetical protein
MTTKNKTGNGKEERSGNSSRTSNQGRKEGSGGLIGKTGNPEIDDATHSPKAGQKKEKRIGERRKAVGK